MNQLVPYEEPPSLSTRIRRMEDAMGILVSRNVIDFDKFRQLRGFIQTLQRKKEKEDGSR